MVVIKGWRIRRKRESACTLREHSYCSNRRQKEEGPTPENHSDRMRRAEAGEGQVTRQQAAHTATQWHLHTIPAERISARHSHGQNICRLVSLQVQQSKKCTNADPVFTNTHTVAVWLQTVSHVREWHKSERTRSREWRRVAERLTLHDPSTLTTNKSNYRPSGIYSPRACACVC